MPVSQPTIKSQIVSLIEQTKGLEQEQSAEAFANGLSSIITAAILSAQVIIPPGGVVVVGSPSTQTNPVPVLGTLS